MATIARMDVKLGMDASDFEAGVAKAQQTTESMSQKLQKTGSMLSLGVTAPLLGIAGAAVKSAGDFEASMNVLQSVSGATASDMKTLTDQALQLGAETSFSAGEAAEAMLELGKGGLAVNDIMGAMPGVLSLAAAGGLSVGSAAQIAANAVNTFGLEATETSNVANMLAAAANASSADVGELAQGFQAAGAVFASNNQSMSDLTTAMSLMANAGVAGSDAGTSLKTMLMRLAAPTAEAAAVMADLGLQTYNSDGSMRTFEAIVGDLSTATAGLSDEQRNAAFATLFGADAIRAANIMTAAGAEGFAAMEQSVNKAGAASEAAGARMSGFSGAMDYIGGSIDSVMIAVASRFLPTLTIAIKTVADFISGFANLSPELQNGVIAFAAVAAAAGPVMLAITGIGAAVGFLLSPLGLVVVGVAALAAAWTTNFGGIQEKTQAVVDAISPIITQLTTSFGLITSAIADAGIGSSEATEAFSTLPAALQPIATAVQSLWMTLTGLGAALQTFLAPAVERLKEAFAGVGPSLTELSGPLKSFQDALGALWTAAEPILTALASAVGATLAVAMDAGINLLANTFEELPGIIGPIIDQVTATIELIATTLKGTSAVIMALMKGDFQGAWDSGQEVLEGFKTFFNDTLHNFNAIATAVFSVLYSTVFDTLTDLNVDAQGIMNQLSAFWTGIWETMSKAIQPVLDAIDALKKGIEGFKEWIGGISIPNPFAGIQPPDLSGFSLPNPFAGKASGGPVTAGVPYIVGERGPEFFVPNRSGKIIPNNELGDWMQGSSYGSSSSGGPLIGTANIYNELDVREVAYQVASYQQRRR